MSPPKICPPRARFPVKFVPLGPNFLGNLSPPSEICPPLRKFVPLQTSNVRLFKSENILYFLFYTMFLLIYGKYM